MAAHVPAKKNMKYKNSMNYYCLIVVTANFIPNCMFNSHVSSKAPNNVDINEKRFVSDLKYCQKGIV